MSGASAKSRVEKARRLHTPDEAAELYRDWAADYDRDVAGTLKFIGGDRIAALLAEHLPAKDARIIDLGCGTGLVGAALAGLGYTAIDGLDLSPEMLAEARRKSVYRNLIEANLLAPLDIPDNTYAAAISAGTFTTGHVNATALPEIHRILTPDAPLACVIADTFWQKGGFAAAFTALENNIAHHSKEAITQDGPAAGHYVIVRVVGSG
jgi:SAM-dependent methyltransferase